MERAVFFTLVLGAFVLGTLAGDAIIIVTNLGGLHNAALAL
jgi:hypothetical protein